MHTGALGRGTSELKTAELVPVLFNVKATTTFGEVSLLLPRVSLPITECLCCTRTSSSWATFRGSETGIRPMRYVCSIFFWVRGPVLSTTHAQIPLDPTNYPVWAATAYLPPGTAFQYSFIRKESNGTVSHFASEHVCTCNRVLMAVDGAP